MVDVILKFKDKEEKEFQADQIAQTMASWVFWYPKDDSGKVKMLFANIDAIEWIELYGDEEGDEEKKPRLASVTSIYEEGGEENRPVS